ncbi:MAG: hypothetical protein DHS20C07_28870 [Methyloligella sp.]|nr:MAG: hypothetical protein DHS20C07_28870 [Methyloligella sp.]
MPKNLNHAGEIYIEFQVVGHSQKVTAIDARTGMEATVIGPAKVTKEHMTNLAVKKLKRKIAQSVN